MRTFLSLVLLLASATALSQAPLSTPTAGFWWNPNESGRGWNIEVQNDFVAITHFVYRADGTATFLQSAGAFDLTTGVVTGALQTVEQGQCIGCPYRNPTTGNIGTVRFEFPNDSQGRVIYPDGTTIAIQPFVYGYSNALTATFGTWMTSWVGASGVVFPHYVQFFRETQINPTLVAAEGRRIFPAGNRPVLASEVAGTYVILVDATTDFNDIYYVSTNVRDFMGLACTYRKGTPTPSINACRSPVYGSRIYSHGQSQRLFPIAAAGQESTDPKALTPFDTDRAAELDASFQAAGDLPPKLEKAALNPAVHAAAVALDQAFGRSFE